MELRKWVYEDIYAIAALEKQCFADAWTFRMLADSFFSENTITVAAAEGDAIVGYGFLVVAGEEADLANIAVAASHRRKGIAEAMLESLESKAKNAGVRQLFLEVRVSNAAAMSLYLKRGFVGCSVRPRYYGDGEDALVMVKKY